MPVLLVFVQALMVWLWGVNVYVFLNTRIPYAKVFELEHNHLTHHEIWKVVPNNLFALQHLTLCKANAWKGKQ
jgi:hypothetical protein